MEAAVQGMASPLHLAIDGWSLVERPWSMGAFHLLEWLDALQGIDPAVGLSVLHPPGSLPQLPEGVGTQQTPAQGTLWRRLHYEQRWLPRLAGALGADWLFLPNGTAPLASPVPTAVLISGPEPDRDRGVLDRLRQSLGRAGAEGAARRLGYADMPSFNVHRARVDQVPPFLGDAFQPPDSTQIGTLDRWRLEPGYVLSCGSSAKQLGPLMAAWTWVEASMGETAPLVLAGLDPAEGESARARAAVLGVESSVRLAPVETLNELADLFRGAAAYLEPGAKSVSQPLRWALGCGVPIAGIDRPDTAAIIGPAGFLVGAGEARSLGAACLSLLVEEPLAADLRRQGLLRAAAWRGPGPLESWLRVFRKSLE